VRTPLRIEPTQLSQSIILREIEEIKVRVKAFEDKKKKCCFLRGKRLLKTKTQSTKWDRNGNGESIYEIDNSEKKVQDRGDETNYLKEIIRNNQKCERLLDQRSVKFTREEILQIFDKEKLKIIENRKRLKKKYFEKNTENPIESSMNKFYYSTLFEALESQKRKKIKIRCQSAMNLDRKNENHLEKKNGRGEIKVNFHIKRHSFDSKIRPINGRPMSGGFLIGKINNKKPMEEKHGYGGIYDKIQNLLLIQGRKTSIGIRNSNLKSYRAKN